MGDVVVCRSTRYGEGCGHPVDAHIGTGECCCCNWQHNDPGHVRDCDVCQVRHKYAKAPQPFGWMFQP